MKRAWLGAAITAACLAAAAPADAAFPGQNGKIAFVQAGDIWTMNADGSGQVNLTNDAVPQSSPSWSPDGARIAFDQDTGTNTRVWTMNADGSGKAMATNGTFPQSRDPAWSPDGTRLVFSNFAGALWTMNPDGTGVVGPITPPLGGNPSLPEWSPSGSLIAFQHGPSGCGPGSLSVIAPDGSNFATIFSNCNVNIFGSSWSPDAQRIAFNGTDVLGCLPSDPCPDVGFFTIRPDGTDRQELPNGGPFPAWSPDGTKIAFDSGSGIRTMNADGTGVSLSLAAGIEPDWQPLLRGYARPKAATPMYTPLVPAHTPCTSPNRVHAAPLSYNSCNPPSQTSGFATVGTPDANGVPAKSVGSLKLVAIGEVPINTGNGNQSDVVIDFDISDVRNPGTLTDYTGGLRVRSALQITDRNNTPYPGGPGPGTVTPTTFEFNVPCATTADTTVGSTCSTSTTANAVLPGQVLERQRAIWELGRVEVHDGGTDGNPSTAGDNTLFATQGIFTP